MKIDLQANCSIKIGNCGDLRRTPTGKCGATDNNDALQQLSGFDQHAFEVVF